MLHQLQTTGFSCRVLRHVQRMPLPRRLAPMYEEPARGGGGGVWRLATLIVSNQLTIT